MSLQVLKVKSEVLKEGTWNKEEDGRLTLIKKCDNPLIATGAYFELTLDKEDWKRLRAEIGQALLQTGLIDIEKQEQLEPEPVARPRRALFSERQALKQAMSARLGQDPDRFLGTKE